MKIWSSSSAKSAGKFCGHWKFNSVFDTYSKVLCLCITSPVIQVSSGRVLCGFVLGRLLLEIFWYPIPAQNLYFHVRSSPTLNYCYYFYFYRRLLDKVSWCIHFLHTSWWRHQSSGSLCKCSTNHSNRMKNSFTQHTCIMLTHHTILPHVKTLDLGFHDTVSSRCVHKFVMLI